MGESTNLNAVFNIPVSQVDPFSWLNPATLDCEGCFSPIAQPTETTTYEAIIYDLNGCFALDEVTVFVEKNRFVYIPNAFSPNEDGFKDLFTIYSGSVVKRIHELLPFGLNWH